MGFLSGLLGGGKTSTTSQNQPWGPIAASLSGNEQGYPGLLGEAARQYTASQPGMAQNQAYGAMANNALNRTQDGFYGDIGADARNIYAGAYAPNLEQVGNVDMNAARAGQGVLDPTQSMSRLLSGQVDNPQLDAMLGSVANRAMTSYGDMNMDAADALNNAFANNRSGAQVAGQYGSNRQGIADGVAAGKASTQLDRTARDLTQGIMDTGANMYGTAYENAQGRMYGTANALNDQAFNTQTFNANLGLQRNNQELNRQQQEMQTKAQGLGLLTAGNTLQDQNYMDYLTALNGSNNQGWENLYNYSGLISPYANIGQTQSNTSRTSDPMAQVGKAVGIAGSVMSGGMLSGGGMMSGGMGGMSNMGNIGGMGGFGAGYSSMPSLYGYY